MAIQVSGVVVAGAGEGRQLGYPTANLKLEAHSLRPPAGIYACWVVSLGIPRTPGVLVSGVHWDQPNVPRLEVYLIGFVGDLYGATLQVEVGERLRDIVAPSSRAELIQQIEQDVIRARQVLNV